MCWQAKCANLQAAHAPVNIAKHRAAPRHGDGDGNWVGAGVGDRDLTGSADSMADWRALEAHVIIRAWQISRNAWIINWHSPGNDLTLALALALVLVLALELARQSNYADTWHGATEGNRGSASDILVSDTPQNANNYFAPTWRRAVGKQQMSRNAKNFQAKPSQATTKQMKAGSRQLMLSLKHTYQSNFWFGMQMAEAKRSSKEQSKQQ